MISVFFAFLLDALFSTPRRSSIRRIGIGFGIGVVGVTAIMLMMTSVSVPNVLGSLAVAVFGSGVVALFYGMRSGNAVAIDIAARRLVLAKRYDEAIGAFILRVPMNQTGYAVLELTRRVADAIVENNGFVRQRDHDYFAGLLAGANRIILSTVHSSDANLYSGILGTMHSLGTNVEPHEIENRLALVEDRINQIEALGVTIQ